MSTKEIYVEQEDSYIGWTGSMGAVAVAAAALYAYDRARERRERQACPGTDVPVMPRVVIPVEIELPDGCNSLESPRFWLKFAKKAAMDQAKIVIPIALYMIGFKDFVLGLDRTANFDIALWGVVAVVFGLGLFLEGLRFGIMPLGEALGKTLPVRAPLPVTLFIALLLGIGVTFAEPAIGALQTVGKDVDVNVSPYLFELLNSWAFALVSAVGAGVGAAAMIGTLRFVKGWSIKPLIYITLSVTLTLTAAVAKFTPPSMAGVIGLAWDCGAVTTGPVTVPLVIALGVGVVSASGRTSSPFSSFGLVTLASLFPVVAVLSLALVLLSTKTPQEIIKQAAAQKILEEAAVIGPFEVSPWKEVLAGTQALGPLLLFLWLVLRIGLRQQMPLVHVRAALAKKSAAVNVGDGNAQDMGTDSKVVLSTVPGVISSYIGIIVFNLGLNHGLSRLGNEGGAALPSAFMVLPSVPQSPIYSYAMGFPIVLIFTFFLGIGATMAEPALAALGMTVDRLTGGRFPPLVLKAAVPVGVASGLVLGIFKVLYDVNLVAFILSMYPIAAVVTYFSSEEFANIGWDSAGVTTGPVTVPLVLSLGSGLSVATKASDGFGLLTLSSICPILSVLIFGHILTFLAAAQTKKEDSEDPEDLADTKPLL